MNEHNSQRVISDDIASIQVDIQRYNPDVDEQPHWQSYTVDWSQDTSVLDILNQIKDEQDPSLSYRWSCRMEVCGSCGMVINGEPKLACSTFVRDYAASGKLSITALDQMPIEKDLIIDMQPFIERLEKIKPYIINAAPRTLSEKEHIQTPKQLAAFKQYTMCINCLLCYQACPQIGINADFLGPAATALAHRYNLDSRDDASKQRFNVLNDSNGIWPCTFVGYCSTVCPKSVDPAGAIQQAKAQAVPYWAMSLFSAKS